MKNLSISIKLSIIIASVLLITIGTITILSSIRNNKVAVEKAEIEMSLTLENSVERIQSIINMNLRELKTIWNVIDNIKKNEGFKRSDTHGFLKDIIKNDSTCIGITVCTEPGKFDGKDSEFKGYPGYFDDGRFCEYFYLEDGKIIRDVITTSFDRDLIESGSDWWLIPQKKLDNYIYMDLYNVRGTDVLMLSVAYTILKDNEFIGVVTKDFVSEFIQVEANSAKSRLFEGRCKITIFDGEGNIVADTETASNIGKDLKEVNPEGYEGIMESIQKGEKMNFNDDKNYYAIVPLKFNGSKDTWQMRVEIPGEVIKEDARKQMWYQIIIGIVSILISILLIFYLTRVILKPLKDLSLFSKHIADGDLTQKLSVTNKDEVGIVASSYNEMAKQLSRIVKDIIENAKNIAQSSNQLASTSEELSQGASEQAASLEEISSTMEEITANVEQSTSNAKETEKTTILANENINELAQKSKFTLQSNKDISDKISIINEIASVTDILAINAAIQAANAGEHGKGFAVVANEVRKLAERSRVAAKEIIELTQKGLDTSEKMGEVMNQTLPKINEATVLVEAITTSSIEQSSSLNQINSSIQQLNMVTQQNASTSEELASSAEELSSQSEELKKLVSYFKIS